MTSQTAPVQLSANTEVVQVADLDATLASLTESAADTHKANLATLTGHARAIVSEILPGAHRVVVAIGGTVTPDRQGSVSISAYSIEADDFSAGSVITR